MITKAVIFDLFGTLIDFSLSRHNECLKEMARVAGGDSPTFQASFQALVPDLAIGKIDLEDAIRDAGCKAGSRGLDFRSAPVAQVWNDEARRSLTPKHGAIETLEELQQLGLGLGVVSGALPPIGDLWAQSAFARVIANPVLSYEVGMRKPDERIYRRACDLLRVSPVDCLYIGDGSSEELTGAQEVGMATFQIRVENEDEASSTYMNQEHWRGPTIRTLREVPGL